VNHEGQLPHSGLLIVIDDSSNDGTAAILDQLTASRKDTRFIRQECRGKGAACEQESRTSPATLRSELDESPLSP
jgi:Glycosyl transferase family 2